MPESDTKTLTCRIQHMTKETLTPFLMFFHIPHPCAPLTTLAHHPPLASPYLEAITCLHKCVTSFPNRQSHFPSKAWLNNPIFQIPKPLDSTGYTTFSQATSENLKTSLDLPQGKFL
ncbi:hypothetical protein ACB092_01G199800 [Castanea dentata]